MLQRFDVIVADLRLAVRSLRRAPGFVVAVVLTLALGIGATSTLFAIVDRLFLRPPAGVVEPNRLHRVYVKSRLTRDGFPVLDGQFLYADYLALADGLRSDGDVAAFTPPDSVSLSTAGELQPIRAVYASANYFSLLGVRAQLGRFFSADEERMTSPVLATVLSDGLWRRSFGSRREALGTTINVDGRRVVVVGIAPPGFGGADLSDADLWLPIPMYPQGRVYTRNGIRPWYEASGPLWAGFPLELIVRARSGATENHLAAVATTVLRRALGGAYQLEPMRPDSTAVALVGSINQALAPALTAKGALTALPETDPSFGIALRLMAVVAVLLLIACLNVSNLMLGRGMQRRREIAARIALGATRRHLIGQTLSECVILTGLAGVAAVAISIWGSAIIKALLLPDAHWSGRVVDLRVVLFTAAVAIVTCVVVALIPGFLFGREDVGRSLTTGRGMAGQAAVLRRALVIVQSALSMVLLVGGGVFFESLSHVQRIDLGYDVDRLISGRVQFRNPQARYGETEGHLQEMALGLEQVAAALTREPSIQNIAIAATPPMSPFAIRAQIHIPGRDSAQMAAAGLGGMIPFTPVSPSYFETTGRRLLQGRLFTDADRTEASDDFGPPHRVAIIGASMAKALWPNEDPVGTCFVIDAGRCVPVVGVVTDAHVRDVVESESMQYYVPLRHRGGQELTIRVRPGQEIQAAQVLWRALRHEFPSAEPPIIEPLADVITPQLRPWRMGASLFSGFGVLALIIAVVGLYGLIAYSVTQRTWEMGLRLALGAQREAILSLVVREGLSFVAIGIAVGTLLSLLAGHAIAALLYETSPSDPGVLAGVALLLCACAAAASFAPGWRASRTDPATALRAE